MKTLIKGASLLLPDGRVIQGNLAIEGEIIAAVGDTEENWAADAVIDGTGKFAIPGFVNAHTHISMTLLRSYADDMKLMDWLENKIWPVEAKMKKEDIYWGAMLAAVEMIRSGTTTFADMYGEMDKVAEANIEAGIRGILSEFPWRRGRPLDRHVRPSCAIYLSAGLFASSGGSRRRVSSRNSYPSFGNEG